MQILKFTIVNFILLKNILDNNLTDIVDIYPFGVGNEIKTLKIKQINLHDNIIFGAVSIIYNLEDKDDSFNIIKELFPDRIEILLGSSVDVLPKLTKKYDLIHIDGCHRSEIAEIDIKNSLSLINNNGIMIMDDIDYKDLNIIWNKYVDNYNLIDVDFEIYNCKFHSIKKYIR